MAAERKLTLAGKFVVLFFVAGCLLGAWYFFSGGSMVNLRSPRPVASPAPATVDRPAASAPRPVNVLQEIRTAGVVVVGHESDAPPMHFTNAQGQPDGFEHQLARLLAEKIGVPRVRFVAAEYGVLPDLLRERRIDLILAGYVPDPSVEGVEWSDSYLDFGLCLIVLKSSAITEPSHLAGRTVAVYEDPAAQRWVRDTIPGAKIKSYSGDAGWFEALERREADALVYDYPFAAAEIKKHPRTKIVKFNLNQSHYAVGLLAGNDALLDAVNQGLRALRDADAYAALVRTYLSYESESLTRPVQGRNTYLVQAGDTLSTIAAARLGSKDRWGEIWELNRERIPNPHLIYPLYVLLMP